VVFLDKNWKNFQRSNLSNIFILFEATIGSWMSLVVGASVLAFFELYYFVAALFMEVVLKKQITKKKNIQTQKDEQKDGPKNEQKMNNHVNNK
jgi:hypothetical protein